MSFAKLVSLLHRKSLYFTRPDRFLDPYEGILPESMLRQFRARPERVIHDPEPSYRAFLEAGRKWSVVNCWHINESESAAMWGLYTSASDGVAIRSTVGRLIESLREVPDPVFLGEVEYLDYQTDITKADFAFRTVLCKRNSFAHEQELRAILLRVPPDAITIGPTQEIGGLRFFGDAVPDYTKEVVSHGEMVGVRLDTLIDELYVSPTCSTWYRDVVEETMKRAELEKVVKHSDLLTPPGERYTPS